MATTLKIGLIREGKNPPDARVAIAPKLAADLHNRPEIDMLVAPSERRTFTDREYAELGLPMSSNLGDRDLLLGIKEVPTDHLIPEKTYCFFSHTIKEQPYNQKLIRAVLEKRIRLIDYEIITNKKGKRLIAFGFYAGMVGAHNGIWAYGKRTSSFKLPRLKECFDYKEAKGHYAQIEWPDMRVVLTGTGRVGKGAAQVLDDMGFARLTPENYLRSQHSGPVYTQLSPKDYARRKSDGHFDKAEFYAEPHKYEVPFEPFYERSDLFINGIYWDPKAPAFFDVTDLRKSNFNIQTIADVTCDIAPEASVPTTLYASTIAKPVFGYDLATGQATEPYGEEVIDVMSIDNLPSELPRDASEAFGDMFVEHVLPEFLKPESELLLRATIAQDGKLGPYFQHLHDYAFGPDLS
ncbi:MAG: NAD(P)-dependent oxidoreductase [Bacteroidota bacterium]